MIGTEGDPPAACILLLDTTTMLFHHDLCEIHTSESFFAMSGIIFFKSDQLNQIVRFYTETIGMSIWLKQDDCTILQYGNLLIGFCQRETTDTEGMITLVFETRQEVDKVFAELDVLEKTPPEKNNKYNIYQFFAADPDGRTLEFQAFLHPVKPL
ncbi:MAG: VOC family protein [Candidatus Thorarchaeota archaeon]